MKKFFTFLIKQSVAIVLIVLFVLAFGIYSTLKMSVNLLPDINMPMVCIQVIYPGNNANSVEKDVTVKLEDGLTSLGGVQGVDSYSYDNLSAVVLSFDYGTDTDKIKSEITGRLPSLNLPEGVITSVYDIDLNAQALAVLSVVSEEGETEEEKLENAYGAANALSAQISALDGVERVQVKGGAEKSYLVQPHGGMELIAPLVVQAFSYGALDIPLGSITEDGASVQIRNNTDIKTENDILEVPLTLPAQFVTVLRTIRAGIAEQLPRFGYEITTPQGVEKVLGTPVLLETIRALLASNESAKDMKISTETVKFIIKSNFETPVSEGGRITADGGFVTSVAEIATVKIDEQFSSFVYFSGGEAKLSHGTVIEVYKSNGANSSAVVDSVKSTYAQYLSGDGKALGAKVTLLDDQSEFISDSISNVLISMLIGGVLAIAVIFLFLKKARTSLIVAITMPLSVLASLICLYLMGITLNMVSLGGLAVGIGMLVDNSIVVIESISKHRDRGKSAFESAVDGATEVGGALFGSTLTTVCVFIPIIFSGGLTGEIFTDLGWAVIFSLTFSLIVALSVIPALYAAFNGKKRMIKGEGLSSELPQADEVTVNQPQTTEAVEKKKSKTAWFTEPRIMNKITAFYGKILPKVLGKRLITILSAVAIFAASVGLLFLTGSEFLPSIDKGTIEVNMSAYGSSATLGDIESDVSAFAQTILSEVDGVDYLSVSIGKNGLLALTDTGVITVQLKTNRGTDKVVEKIRALSESETTKPKGAVTVKQIDGVVASLTSGASDMSVTITGSDGEVLKSIAAEISEKLGESGFKDISNSAVDKAVEYDIKVDRAKLESYGIDYQTMIMTLRVGLASHTACTVTIGGETFNLNVKFADGSVEDISDFRTLVVGANGMTPVTVADVCTIERIETDACIRRSDGRQMISVSAALPGVDTGAASDKMQEIASGVLKSKPEYAGYAFESSGVSSYLTDAFSGLAVSLVISFFLLYAVMAIQFGSAIKPLIIMASIPFSFTGGFIALVITGTSLNVVSFIGLIMLMGVVVNNAIVMLEKIMQLHDGGEDHFTAVCEACKVRLRPILMTTLTTILALIPMAIGVGQGSELMQPLGIVVIGGLLIGTLVTLVLVPAVYCAVHRLNQRIPNPDTI